MHNIAAAPAVSRPAPRSKVRAAAPRPAAAEPILRLAQVKDVPQVATLVNGFADQGLMLHRSEAEILRDLHSYVVAATPAGRVLACAALTEYSPSLAEVSSVAVAPDAHGKGLGSRVVLAVERVARLRDIHEIFAMSLSDPFFLQLGYDVVPLTGYPEKVARYDRMRADGKAVVEKRCFRKILAA